VVHWFKVQAETAVIFKDGGHHKIAKNIVNKHDQHATNVVRSTNLLILNKKTERLGFEK